MHHLDILRNPDHVVVQRGQEWLRLEPSGSEWGRDGISVSFVKAADGLAVRVAFRAASKPHAPSRPLDWLHTNTPSLWREADGTVKEYDWVDADRLESMEGMLFEEI